MVLGILLAGIAILESMLKEYNIKFEGTAGIGIIVPDFSYFFNLEYLIPPVCIRSVFFNSGFPIINYNEF